ncbi:MAG: hypothetical protein JO328_08070 [Hyphomicrobiales bacterium]|nr:hypothetical protein [Hyphomicrobiales bacterium]
MKIGNLVVEPDRLADQFDRKLAATGLDGNQPEQIETVKLIRNRCQDLPVERLGLRKLAPLVKRDGFGKNLLDIVPRNQ